jgi:hypothetical protein
MYGLNQELLTGIRMRGIVFIITDILQYFTHNPFVG